MLKTRWLKIFVLLVVLASIIISFEVGYRQSQAVDYMNLKDMESQMERSLEKFESEREKEDIFCFGNEDKIFVAVVIPDEMATNDEKKTQDWVKTFLSKSGNWSRFPLEKDKWFKHTVFVFKLKPKEKNLVFER